jgi:mannose-6-phosphate isomerase-like protein (cupin superfamily)
MSVSRLIVGVSVLSLMAWSGGATAQTRTPTRGPGLNLTVTTQTGEPIEGAIVTADGPVSREGETNGAGLVSFTMTAGTYRCRIEREGYVTLEKEVTVKAGAVHTTAETSLSPAPAAAAPAQAAATLTPGEPVIVDVTELAAEELKERAATVERTIGCSGATSARLLRLTESLPASTEDEADQVLYVVAGEASLTVGPLDRRVEAGSFGIVPRGTRYSVTRRGRNPLLLLVVTSGPPCP